MKPLQVIEGRKEGDTRVARVIHWLSLKEIESRARVEMSESNEFGNKRLSKRE